MGADFACWRCMECAVAEPGSLCDPCIEELEYPEAQDLSGATHARNTVPLDSVAHFLLDRKAYENWVNRASM